LTAIGIDLGFMKLEIAMLVADDAIRPYKTPNTASFHGLGRLNPGLTKNREKSSSARPYGNPDRVFTRSAGIMLKIIDLI